MVRMNSQILPQVNERVQNYLLPAGSGLSNFQNTNFARIEEHKSRHTSIIDRFESVNQNRSVRGTSIEVKYQFLGRDVT